MMSGLDQLKLIIGPTFDLMLSCSLSVFHRWRERWISRPLALQRVGTLSFAREGYEGGSPLLTEHLLRRTPMVELEGAGITHRGLRA
jgi:hypothetical protein